MKKPVACIYKDKLGHIYQLRVVTSKAVTTVPVKHSSEREVRRYIRKVWGSVELLISQEVDNQYGQLVDVSQVEQ